MYFHEKVQRVYASNSGWCYFITSLDHCWVSWVGGALRVLKLQPLLCKGGSPCGHDLEHYFNYKSVTSFHLLESNVISSSVSFWIRVALTASPARACPESGLLLPCWEQRRSQSFWWLFYLFFYHCFAKQSKKLVWVFTPSAPTPSYPQTCSDLKSPYHRLKAAQLFIFMRVFKIITSILGLLFRFHNPCVLSIKILRCAVQGVCPLCKIWCHNRDHHCRQHVKIPGLKFHSCRTTTHLAET